MTLKKSALQSSTRFSSDWVDLSNEEGRELKHRVEYHKMILELKKNLQRQRKYMLYRVSLVGRQQLTNMICFTANFEC